MWLMARLRVAGKHECIMKAFMKPGGMLLPTLRSMPTQSCACLVLTSGAVQRTVREAFAECTVLTVAHRLHTIIDYDRILVLEAGQALEFGSPQELMQVNFPRVVLHAFWARRLRF